MTGKSANYRWRSCPRPVDFPPNPARPQFTVYTEWSDFGAPYGIRTRVAAVKGRCPRPLDEGRNSPGRIVSFAAIGKGRCDYHFPVLGMDFHGSCAGRASPFCKSSMECLSGERTKAMTPSRGGRLMVTPAFISLSQVA